MSYSAFFHNLMQVSVTSADINSVYDLIIREGFNVYSVAKLDELTSRFTIRRDEYSDLQRVLRKRGETLCVTKKEGMYWSLRSYLKRPILYVFALFLLTMTIMIPTRVFFVRVIGNTNVSDKRIIEASNECGIRFGVSRRSIRNENLKNDILTIIPELEWAGINTQGCVATIMVREKGSEVSRVDEGPSNIVAARDAVISSIVVSKGTSHCAVGDSVLKGELLLSGYTDCGNVLLQGSAEGEVYGYSSRELDAVMPLAVFKKGNMTKQEQRYCIVIGKKRINLWKGSGIWPTTCDRIYQEYWVCVPGGYTLPVCLIRETVRYYDVTAGTTEIGEDDILSGMLRYLEQHMIAGSVLHQDVQLTQNNDVIMVSGVFGCHEIIGQQISEKLGETYG